MYFHKTKFIENTVLLFEYIRYINYRHKQNTQCTLYITAKIKNLDKLPRKRKIPRQICLDMEHRQILIKDNMFLKYSCIKGTSTQLMPKMSTS